MFDKDEDYNANKGKCQQLGINVYMLEEIIGAGNKSKTALELDKLTKDDVIMLNYTSGTTGAPKGVKVHAFGSVMDCGSTLYTTSTKSDDVFISYLPSPHVFD